MKTALPDMPLQPTSGAPSATLMRRFLRGLPWLFGIAAAVLFGTLFAASLGSDRGFVMMLQSTRLLFPTSNLEPPIATPVAWLLGSAYWVLVATIIGSVIASAGSIRKALSSIVVVVIVGSALQLALWLFGYRHVLRIEM